jgi:hypothetical protein
MVAMFWSVICHTGREYGIMYRVHSTLHIEYCKIYTREWLMMGKGYMEILVAPPNY